MKNTILKMYNTLPIDEFYKRISKMEEKADKGLLTITSEEIKDIVDSIVEPKAEMEEFPLNEEFIYSEILESYIEANDVISKYNNYFNEVNKNE